MLGRVLTCSCQTRPLGQLWIPPLCWLMQCLVVAGCIPWCSSRNLIGHICVVYYFLVFKCEVYPWSGASLSHPRYFTKFWCNHVRTEKLLHICLCTKDFVFFLFSYSRCIFHWMPYHECIWCRLCTVFKITIKEV